MSSLTWHDWLFSAKAFVAAMLALYIALLLDLTNPYWAVGTVYIVSHPLSGATHSKAIYRATGTMISAAGAVILVPLLVATPVLLSLAVATWVGVVLYLALLNRTPSGYVFMLSAYTMPLIALGAVDHPEQIWNIALSRTEEIVLGIVCASVVNTLVLPQRMAPIIGARMEALLGAASAWTQTLFAADEEARQAMPRMRQELIGDLGAMDALIRQMAYDAESHMQSRHAQQFRLRMTMLVPQATSLAEAIEALHQVDAATPASIRVLLEDTLAWMQAGADAAPDAPTELREALAARLHASKGTDISTVLARNALLRLRELIDLWQDALALRHAYARGSDGLVPTAYYRAARLSENIRYFDHGLLMWSAISAGLATFVAAMLWIAIGWTWGSGAVLLVAVGNCFFATVDDPRPQLTSFLTWIIVGAVFALIYMFQVLPQMQGYWGLVAVLAPPFLIAGAFVGQPRYYMAVVLFTVLGVTYLNLGSAYQADFIAFSNSVLAAVLGIIFTIVWTAISKPFGTEWIAHRLARASWRDLARLAHSRVRADQVRVTSRLLDRTSQLLPRVAALREKSMAQLDAVRDVRVALRLQDIEATWPHLRPEAAVELEPLLDEIASHYAACDERGHLLPAPDVLLDHLDQSISRLARQAHAASDYLAQTLAGLRIALYRTDALVPGRATLDQPELH